VPTYTEIFGRSLIQLAKENPKVIGITAAMGSGTGLDKMAKEIPDRVYDVGLAEQHAVTFAAGMATEGLIPVVAIYSTFLQRAYDQILHDVCVQNLHVVFALDRVPMIITVEDHVLQGGGWQRGPRTAGRRGYYRS